MTQEEKELLLTDLCSRLPYRVKVLGPWKKDGPCKLSAIDLTCSRQIRVFEDWFSVEDVRPYLRPMSSMTEEEINEWVKASNMKFDMEDGFLDAYDAHLSIDWLNEHHFDYRGLIPMGLALEASEDMYQAN